MLPQIKYSDFEGLKLRGLAKPQASGAGEVHSVLIIPTYPIPFELSEVLK